MRLLDLEAGLPRPIESVWLNIDYPERCGMVIRNRITFDDPLHDALLDATFVGLLHYYGASLDALCVAPSDDKPADGIAGDACRSDTLTGLDRVRTFRVQMPVEARWKTICELWILT